MKIALNDIYIELLITDPRYEIRPDGTIWTTVCRTGKNSINKTWRLLSLVSTESGHLTVKYRRKPLYIHRVIHRKFNGSTHSMVELYPKFKNFINLADEVCS